VWNFGIIIWYTYYFENHDWHTARGDSAEGVGSHSSRAFCNCLMTLGLNAFEMIPKSKNS